jgi:hypothetical protein
MAAKSKDETSADNEAETPSVPEQNPNVPRHVGEIKPENFQADTEDERQTRRYNTISGALRPGDQGYNPHHDPLVPSSTVADTIAIELRGSKGKSSPTWNGLAERAEAERKRFEAHRAADQGLFPEE